MIIMKKLKSVIMIIVMLICVYTVSFAHGGNITGWKEKKVVINKSSKFWGRNIEIFRTF